jgi:SynChlorMet cassette radical SAM/SPASM protein ScmF
MPINELNLPEGVPPLKTYYLYMAGSCNLACRHCWITPTYLAANELDTGEKSLPFDLYELAIREGEPLGLNHLKFTGGEPFVHPEAERMLLYAAERQLGVTIETNGTLITNERARFLREKTSVTFLSVSLDGASADTHDYMRGRTGSFARAQAGIKNLVEYGYHPQVIMSLFEGNVDEIEALAQWAASAGCSSLKLNIIQESGRGSQFGERFQGIEQLIKLGHWVKEDLQKRVGFPIFYSWPPAFRRLRDMTNGEGYASCDIYNILGILHTGQLAMCGIGEQDKKLVYGMLGKDPVAEVWASHPVLKQIREAIPSQLEGVCGDCILRDACLGLCPADNYHRTGSILAPFWFCSQADQAGLFPESRKRKTDH